MTDISTHTAGKSFRKGLSLPQLFRLFLEDETAEAWFIQRRWPNGITCPHCGSKNVQTGPNTRPCPSGAGQGLQQAVQHFGQPCPCEDSPLRMEIKPEIRLDTA